MCSPAGASCNPAIFRIRAITASYAARSSSGTWSRLGCAGGLLISIVLLVLAGNAARCQDLGVVGEVDRVRLELLELLNGLEPDLAALGNLDLHLPRGVGFGDLVGGVPDVDRVRRVTHEQRRLFTVPDEDALVPRGVAGREDAADPRQDLGILAGEHLDLRAREIPRPAAG